MLGPTLCYQALQTLARYRRTWARKRVAGVKPPRKNASVQSVLTPSKKLNIWPDISVLTQKRSRSTVQSATKNSHARILSYGIHDLIRAIIKIARALRWIMNLLVVISGRGLRAMGVNTPPNSLSIDGQTPAFAAPDSSIHFADITPLTSLSSLEAEDAWYERPQPVLQYDRLDQQWEAILTGDDFDLDAVNMSLLHTTSDFLSTMQTPPVMPAIRTQHSIPNVDENLSQPLSLVHTEGPKFPETVTYSNQVTPNPSQEGNNIDESYRKRLAEHLQQPAQYGILPSTPFLDLCIQAYFCKFHPLFPVVHKPTFRPGTQNSMLLLSICSAGSLIIGCTRALAHGISMFERLNKANLASWDTFVSKSGCEAITAMQAVLIGQTFGLLMGRPKDLFCVDIFHGTLIALARIAKLFHSKHCDINILDLHGQPLEDAWMTWVMTEVKMRIVLGLHIHDAELARIHHHEPLLRHSLNRLPKISSNELFAAPNARHWKMLMLNTLQPPNQASPSAHPQDSPTNNQSKHQPTHSSTPDFAVTGMLETISALASEVNNSECHTLLTTWYTHYALRNSGPSPSRLNHLILWHSIFITLHSDINDLEIACSSDSHDSTQKDIDAHIWIRSPDAKRCLLHAMHIQRHFETLPTGMECAFHVPLCLYYCGLLWACYMCFGAEETITSEEQGLWAELLLDGIDSISGIEKIVPKKIAMASLFRVVGLLQRLSYWKIAQGLAGRLLGIVERRNLF
ncbi:hypothetical protein N7457_007546 [Penicillium paradoxum]|uniref:uncharacterized protein n=1 Tax=Penicillium paradoxum TaxID=176176 RepID=UPI0025489C3D|nr:uncharacterized protein N7457_007546 [Penicillium paradoxum]KAJ5779826.1 hypothetical protein N7457_007546 [Penicillium paradoxum]